MPGNSETLLALPGARPPLGAHHPSATLPGLAHWASPGFLSSDPTKALCPGTRPNATSERVHSFFRCILCHRNTQCHKMCKQSQPSFFFFLRFSTLSKTVLSSRNIISHTCNFKFHINKSRINFNNLLIPNMSKTVPLNLSIHKFLR